MKLSVVHPLDVLTEEVTSINRGLLYYVHTGRNAWHCTWVTQYFPGCMHTTLESAKEFAESARTNGTVFYIKQLPCMIFRSKSYTLLVTEINSSSPFSGYSVSRIDPSTGEAHKNENLLKGTSLKDVALSFDPYDGTWDIKPSKPDNSVITLGFNGHQTKIEKANSDNLRAFKSYSQGSRYYLGWRDFESRVSRDGILRLYRISKPRKVKKNESIRTDL